ncbi:MAG: catalase [Oscillospiraceae bacterium]|nr:catalase [Oscillospiraceae bacterium]
MLEHFTGHLRTVRNHRREVMRNCFRAGIPCQGLLHDLSKYSPTEFIPSVKYYQGTRSPNEQERIVKGYSEAWMHHKGRNKHHFEYWTDYSPETRQLEPVKMPLRYVAEMFCDRVGASKIYNGVNYTDRKPLEYFLKAKPTRKIHPETSRFLEILLKMLAMKGEDFTFAWLNWYLKTHKDY